MCLFLFIFYIIEHDLDAMWHILRKILFIKCRRLKRLIYQEGILDTKYYWSNTCVYKGFKAGW